MCLALINLPIHLSHTSMAILKAQWIPLNMKLRNADLKESTIILNRIFLGHYQLNKHNCNVNFILIT